MAARHLLRLAAAALACTLAALWLCTGGTLSGFRVASLVNAGADTGFSAATLSVSNSRGGAPCAATATSPSTTTSCTSSVYPAGTASGTNTQTNTVTNTGTVPAAAITARYRIAGCGAVDLANSGTSATNGPMLVRSGTTLAPASGPFPGAGSVSLASSSYAASVAPTSEPVGPPIGTFSYGLGIWFATTSTAGSPLFSFAAAPTTGTGADDRVLYVDAKGKIGFIATTSGVTTPAGKASGVTRYNDGSWHFAYVSISGTRIVQGIGYTVAIYVDGKPVTTVGSSRLGALSSYAGYWHIGWASVSPASGYFTGSLSGFTVDDSGRAPTSAPSSNPGSVGWDAGATQLWPLNDSGGTFDGVSSPGGIYTGGNPGGVDPCSLVAVTWTLDNPSQTVTTGAFPTLASMVSASYRTTSAPGAVPETQTITLTSTAPSGSYAVGLVLYAPVQSTYAAGTTWSVSFTWNAPAAGSTAGSTVVIS